MPKKTTNNSRLKNFLSKDKEKDRSEFIAAIIINIILWFIVNNLLNWNLSFISPTFIQVQGIIYLLITTTILINIIFLFYQATWFRNLLKMITDILGILVAYTLLVVFPFILNEVLALVLTILLILAIIGGIIGLIIHLLKVIYVLSD
jgi:hypothetical protein